MKKDRKAFLKTKRKGIPYRPVCERITDFKEVAILPSSQHSKEQAHRCMECGTPFCHWACPIGNYIPEWNDALALGRWEDACDYLFATNNFPEITGRLCPALCEYSCVLGINDDPVAIKENELAISEYAFKEDYLKPRPPKKRTGKKVAIVGSGPAGLAAADQLNKAGQKIVIFEKDDAAGGILRYGIPDFKLEKSILERRIKIMEKEGVEFIFNKFIEKDAEIKKLKKQFDAIILAIGSSVPRDLKLPGRELKGIHFAMDYLIGANRKANKKNAASKEEINAKGKKVLVIGGGDTGADCVGVANRQGASCVTQIELMPKPPECRTESEPWPKYPLLLKTSSSHQEGGQRLWSILTKEFKGQDGKVNKILCKKINMDLDKNGCPLMEEIPNSDFEIEADLIIIAVGFLGPRHSGLIDNLGLKLDKKGNIQTNSNYMTSKKAIFSAGDCRRGQSLIVWAIAEGRRTAYFLDSYLMGESYLPKI
ncbi:MAG: glutamate synthase subunit beta [Candidatus Omnitrophica bacterium]|nr:glutamate synthase subunit beta [Candidatus Omnitrophota bacterium]